METPTQIIARWERVWQIPKQRAREYVRLEKRGWWQRVEEFEYRVLNDPNEDAIAVLKAIAREAAEAGMRRRAEKKADESSNKK